VLGPLTNWLPATATPVELVWTLPAVYGYVRYTVRYLRAHRERRRAYRDPAARTSERLVQDARCVRFLCLTVTFECFVGLGGWVLLTVPTPAQWPEPAAVIPAGCLFGALVLLLFKGWVLDRYEAAIMAHLRQRRGE
jgi:hypothetical protein